MLYRLLADLIMIAHLVWVLFVLVVFVLTIRAFWRPSFWDRWVIRSVHAAGLLLTALVAILDEICPLTVWEFALRRRHDPSGDYPGSFVIGYLQKLLYPDVDPLVYLLPMYVIAGSSVLMYLIRPPASVWRWKK